MLTCRSINEEMQPNQFGQTVMEWWNEIENHFPYVELDAFVLMPNHSHGIVVFTNNPKPVGAGRPRPMGLGQVMGYFKYQSTKQINFIRQTPGLTIWQRNYYERIIQNETELNRIREYIEVNPAKWDSDKENPVSR